MAYLTVSDLYVTEGEPRIHDIILAERLGMSRPRDIRANLIRPNIDELVSFGGLRETDANPTAKGGQPSKAYYLNEAQALLICMFSRTPAAADVRRQVIEVFMAWRTGKIVPVRSHARRPPQPTAKFEHFEMKQMRAGDPFIVTAVVPFSIALKMLDVCS